MPDRGNDIVRPEAAEPRKQQLGEVVRLFLRLGVIGFGGPAAHIAMMRDEVVRRRGWIDDAEFLDLVGATNLIPGPNSTELSPAWSTVSSPPRRSLATCSGCTSC